MQLLWRYVLAWLGCLGVMNVYFCRINISIAMVAMVGVEGGKAQLLNSSISTCPSRLGVG